MKINNNNERIAKRRPSASSSNGHINKSLSNRHIKTTKQCKTTLPDRTNSTHVFEPPTSDLDATADSNQEQLHRKEESRRRPLASNMHYLLPTVSSLQHRITPFILPLPELQEMEMATFSTLPVVVPPRTDETSKDEHDKQAERQASALQLEKDQHEAILKQRKVSENVVKLYARYLQWEWVALKLEKSIKEQKSHFKEQLLEAKNTCTEAESSSDGKKWLQEWEETYLLPIQEDVGLLESNGLDVKVADKCLLQIKAAIFQLNRFKGEIPQKMHEIYMVFLEDCFHYMQDIYKDMINISYASLLNSI